ncbi:flavodoxin domain-containing protein [Sulfitobacter sp. LCG007]
MKIMIVYATVEGQTGKIARFVESELRTSGQRTELLDTARRVDPVSFSGIDLVVLAAPVHERRHPQTFEIFVATHRKGMSAIPTLMISVSLSAAFPEGREAAADYLTEMSMRTGFTPDESLLCAGAVRVENYDYFAEQVLRHVVLRGRDYDPAKGSHEFTDWTELRRVVSDFVTEEAELDLP